MWHTVCWLQRGTIWRDLHLVPIRPRMHLHTRSIGARDTRTTGLRHFPRHKVDIFAHIIIYSFFSFSSPINFDQRAFRFMGPAHIFHRTILMSFLVMETTFSGANKMYCDGIAAPKNSISPSHRNIWTVWRTVSICECVSACCVICAENHWPTCKVVREWLFNNNKFLWPLAIGTATTTATTKNGEFLK